MKLSHLRARQVSPRRHRSTVLGAVLVLVLSAVGLVAVGVPSASAAGSPSPTVDAASRFPLWYQDSAGNRVEPCIDPLDANCVLAPSEFFDPAQPVSFPANYPDEFTYALADSAVLSTQGCAGTAPGKASVRLALEGAFLNGQPVGGDQTPPCPPTSGPRTSAA